MEQSGPNGLNRNKVEQIGLDRTKVNRMDQWDWSGQNIIKVDKIDQIGSNGPSRTEVGQSELNI